MSLLPSQRMGYQLLYLIFHIAAVSGRGSGKGGDGSDVDPISDGTDRGSDIADGASPGLDLGPADYALFALAIIIGFITALQFLRALALFRRLPPLVARGGELVPANAVGVLFCVFLSAYTVMYTVKQALYATYFASYGGTFFLPYSFQIGAAFTSQLSTVLLYATFLAVVAYRQRIQLNPRESPFNTKTLLDSLVLLAVLFSGVADDIIMAGTRTFFERLVTDSALAFRVFSLLACLDVAISSWVAHARLSEARIHDKVISISTFAISPIVLTGAIYNIIDAALKRNARRSAVNFLALFIVTVVIDGVVSIAAVAYALRVMAPAPKEEAEHRSVAEKTV